MKKHILVLSLAAILAIGGSIYAVSAGISNSETPTMAEDANDGKCQEALDLLDLNVDLQQVVSSFRLPYKGQYGAAISWTSSNPSTISIASDSAAGFIASVTRGDATVTVTLTATATLKGSVSASKDFAAIVLKKSGSVISDLPLAISDDFSDYASGIELSNYFKWNSSSSEVSLAHAQETIPGNFNDMPSAKVLAIDSARTANTVSYTRNANIPVSETPTGAILEGDILFKDQTNGVALEMLNASSQVVGGFKVSSSAYSYFAAGDYTASTIKTPEEGIWQHFRLQFRPKSGYSVFSIYDWSRLSYVDLTASDAAYVAGGGVSSGSKGDVKGLRISVGKGSNFGTSYLANLKVDKAENMPVSTPVNPNRSQGLGTITHYQPTIFAYVGEAIEGLNPDFVVYNRFDSAIMYTKGSDYTVTSENGDDEDGSKRYTYTFTLTSTGEKKSVYQNVYFATKSEVVSLTNFKVSYLKNVVVNKLPTANGYLTISGQVIRNDGTLYYLVLDKGSTAPTSDEIIAGSSSQTGYAASGNAAITTRNFSIDTPQVSYSKEYDVYAVVKNSNGVSSLYSSKEISTVINIMTCQEFYDMSYNLSTLSSTFRLLNDLDFSSFFWNFDPTASTTFTGVLDGQCHTLKNLTISNASNGGQKKTGIFTFFNGTAKNLVFENTHVSGYTDVGILGGNSYGCTVSNVAFNNCTVDEESTLTGGDGYMAIVVGRCRSSSSKDSDCQFTNISIKGAKIVSTQRSGLLVGGLAPSSGTSLSVSVSNVIAEGSIALTTGGLCGLIGRNQGGDLTIENVLIFLEVKLAKKEVGAVLGANETGGKVKANNVYGDLRIHEMTQPTYFGQFIGYDSNVTGSGGKAYAFSCSNLYFLNNDYSDIGDNIIPINNAISPRTMVDIPDEYSQEWWETKTFLRDLDTSLVFSYDKTTAKPILKVKTPAELASILKAEDLTKWIDQIDLTDIGNAHYALYKAEDVLAYLSEEEKAKVSADALTKLAQAKQAYDALVKEVGDVANPIGL